MDGAETGGGDSSARDSEGGDQELLGRVNYRRLHALPHHLLHVYEHFHAARKKTKASNSAQKNRKSKRGQAATVVTEEEEEQEEEVEWCGSLSERRWVDRMVVDESVRRTVLGGGQ